MSHGGFPSARQHIVTALSEIAASLLTQKMNGVEHPVIEFGTASFPVTWEYLIRQTELMVSLFNLGLFTDELPLPEMERFEDFVWTHIVTNHNGKTDIVLGDITNRSQVNSLCILVRAWGMYRSNQN